MANRFWEFVGQFIPGTTVRAAPVNDKFEGIESAFEAIEGELDLSIRLPSTYTGTRSLPEADPRECLLYVNASNQLAFYGMATFTASVNDVAIKHADVVARHADIITRHDDVTTKHGDVSTKHAAIMAMNFGTAAFLNATSFATDTIIGRVTRVGDYGLLGVGPIGADANLNTLLTSGVYFTGSGSTNAPAAGAFLVHVIGGRTSGSVNNRIFQVAHAYSPPIKAYIRASADGGATWSSWLEVMTAANVTQSNMDTTAGRLLKVGDFGLGGSQVILTDNDLNNASVGGFFLTTMTPTNIPAGWSAAVRKQLININNGSNYAAQILIGMDSTDAGKMAIRTRSGGGVWSGWRESLASNNAALAALSALTPAADRLGYFDGAGSAALATLTAFARTLLDDADAATARATLGLGSRTISASGDGSWSVSFDGTSNVTSALTLANSGVTAGTYPKVTVDAKGRVTAGAALAAADIPALDWTKITTGKPTTLAGYGITNAQPLDPTLTAMAGVATSAGTFIYFSGTDTAGAATLTAFALTLLDDADAAAARTTLGAQASDATLTALAGLATSANKVPYFTGTDTAAMFDITSFSRGWLSNATSDPSARYNMKAYGGDLGSLWAGSHVVADSPLTSSISLSSFPAYGVLHIQYLYGSQYGSFAVPYSQGGYAGQRFAIGAGCVSITEITSALIRFQAVSISGSVTITQIWAQV